MSQPNKKLILVIGATGAQGIYVIDALLAPAQDGTPSLYAVRALTRDTQSRRAKELAAKGVQLAQGKVTKIVDSSDYEDVCLTSLVSRYIRRLSFRLEGFEWCLWCLG